MRNLLFASHAFFLLTGFLLGWIVAKHVPLSLYLELAGLKSRVFTNTAHKVVINPPDSGLTVLALGQSNAGNTGIGYQRKENINVLNYWNGNWYIATSPLLGAEGKGSNIWPYLADQLIEEHNTIHNVTIVNYSIGATSIAFWNQASTRLKLNQLRKELAQQNITPHYILWVQGEEDNRLGTDAQEFAKNYESLIQHLHSHWPKSHIYSAISTRCQANQPSQKIKNIIEDVSNKYSFTFVGPNTDLLGPAYRFDGCHFNEDGTRMAVELWKQKLTGHILRP